MAKRRIITLLIFLAMAVAFYPFAATRVYAFDIDYFSTSSDGYMSVEGTIYAIEWANTTADTVDSTHADGDDLYIGQRKLVDQTETLLPTANGPDSEWDSTCDQPSCEACPPCSFGDRWEVVSDSDDTTWLKESFDTENGDWDTDTFVIEDSVADENTAISKVQVIVKCQRGSGAGVPKSEARTTVITHSTAYYGTATSLTTGWQNITTEYVTNPYTSAAWTIEEVNDLIAGADCNYQGITTGSPMCSQVSVKVFYDIYTIYKTAVYIDTTALLTDVPVASADLKIYVGSDDTDTDFDIIIQRDATGTYPSDPLVAGDFDRTLYSGNGGSYDTSSGMSSWITIPLNADGLSWINTGGITKFILRSDHDISGISPTQNEYASFHSQEYGNAPKIEVTYTTPDPPYSFACEPTSSSQIDLSWVTGSGASYMGVWAKVGSYPTDRADGVQIYQGTAEAYSYEGLSLGVAYYFRAWSYNTTTASWSSTYSETYCTTMGGAPTYLLAIPLSSSQIGLTWEQGEQYTGIYFKLGGYPGSRADGTQVYYGTAESYTHKGLDPGTTYYYRAWGYDPDSEEWSPSYDEDMATTLLSGEAGGPDAPPMPDEWFQTPSCEAYGSMPGYTLIIGLADSFSMPYASICLISTSFLIVGTMAVGMFLGGTLIGLAVMAVGIMAAAIAGLLPMWFLLVALAIGAGLAYIWTRV